MADSDLFLVTDYRTLMGAFVERKQMLGLTNLELDELGGFAGGYTSKLFCGSKRLGLETLGKMLLALQVRILVVPEDSDLARDKLKLDPIPIKDLGEETKKIRHAWRRKAGLKGAKIRFHMLSPAKRKAIACMAGRASAEARRLRKMGQNPTVKTANPAIMRKLERRPVIKPKQPGR